MKWREGSESRESFRDFCPSDQRLENDNALEPRAIENPPSIPSNTLKVIVPPGSQFVAPWGMDPSITAKQETVDEGLFAPIGGIDHWVTMRGTDLRNPLLLMVSGPGFALSSMTPFFAPWETSFTLLQWDQPGAGATFARNGRERTGPLTFDRLARDGVAVAEFCAHRLGVPKVVVLGISGGSIVALRMIKQRPQLFSAFVGTGQIVHWARQDALSYAQLLESARAAGEPEMRAALEKIGPPPYPDTATDAIKSRYAGALTPDERREFAELDPATAAALKTPPAGARYVAQDLVLENPFALSMAAYNAIRPELVAFDAWALGLDFAVPVFFFQGERDLYTVTSEVDAYAAAIRAPLKIVASVEGGGHSCFFLRSRFLALLNRHVRPVAAAPQARSHET